MCAYEQYTCAQILYVPPISSEKGIFINMFEKHWEAANGIKNQNIKHRMRRLNTLRIFVLLRDTGRLSYIRLRQS